MKTFRWPLRCVPQIKAAGRFPMPASNSGRKYCHDTYAFHQHLYDGKMTMDRATHYFHAGDITITPPGVIATYQLPEGGHHWCVHFGLAAALPAPPFLHLPLHLKVEGGEIAHIRERLSAVGDTFRPWNLRQKETELAAASAGTLFQALLLFLVRQRGRDPVRPDARHRRSDALLDAFKERLDRNFTHQFQLSDFVSASGLSRNFFTLRFRQRFGTTVSGYLLHLRIEMARNLLLSTDQPIKEIAFECGIPDPNYFNKQFRRVTGLSPVLYRARNRAK